MLADLAGPGWQKSVTAIYSPKGGDGKTFVAVNVAYLLGVVGHRKTLLVDADPKANVHVALHVPEDRNLFGLLMSILDRPASGAGGGPDEVSARTLSAFVSHFGDPKKSNLDVLVGLPRLELQLVTLLCAAGVRSGCGGLCLTCFDCPAGVRFCRCGLRARLQLSGGLVCN